jgi:Tol biopolymer transport system component
VPGSAETELTPGQDPAWRPVGESWIAYSGRARDGAGPAGIWLITDNASRWQNATVNERDRRPAWSPDAQSLVFMSDGRSGNWDVYLLPLPSIDAPGPVEQLTQSPAQDGLPVFSPDGNYIAYASDEGGRWRIWVLPLEEGARPLPVVDIRGSLINWLEHSIQWVAK